jgi:uncharacterized protein
MNSQSFQQARQYALGRLENELSHTLRYHGLTHTRDDVVPSVETLGAGEGVSGVDFDLLRTAAWFHDIGFIEQAPYHELISARIAVEVLPGFGYSEREVEIVRWIIMATVIPQNPSTLLEKLMADADLNVLGRTDFLPRNMALRQELVYSGKIYTDEQWYSGQLKFIESHSFFTVTAHRLLDAQKALNIATLKRLLAEAQS